MAELPPFDEIMDKLNAYPHIQNQLLYRWGTAAARDYLEKLKISDRSNRQGFPFEIIICINELCELHDNAFPQFKPKTDHWDIAPNPSHR